MKALDCYLLLCLIFVFAALIEYAFVAHIHQKLINESTEKSKNLNNKDKKTTDINSNETQKAGEDFSGASKMVSKLADYSLEIRLSYIYTSF